MPTLNLKVSAVLPAGYPPTRGDRERLGAAQVADAARRDRHAEEVSISLGQIAESAMPTPADRAHRVLPSGLAGLAGLTCAACCAIPLLLAAGVLSGAGWATAGGWMLGVAFALAALAGAAWWWAHRRRHRAGCGGADCTCGTG